MRFFFRKGGEKKKKDFPRAKSYDFTLRIPKTVKSEATLQHKGSALVEAEQTSLGNRPTRRDPPGHLQGAEGKSLVTQCATEGNPCPGGSYKAKSQTRYILSPAFLPAVCQVLMKEILLLWAISWKEVPLTPYQQNCLRTVKRFR